MCILEKIINLNKLMRLIKFLVMNLNVENMISKMKHHTKRIKNPKIKTNIDITNNINNTNNIINMEAEIQMMHSGFF